MTEEEIKIMQEYGFTEEQIKSAVQKNSKKRMKREVYDEDRRFSERERRSNRSFRNIKSLKKK